MYLSHFQSDKQKIELLKLPKFGLTLFLDGACQFSELNEKRYHETLSVIPMLFGEFENILICGGGDGLAVTRLLKFPKVKNICVCEYDESMIELAKTQLDLVNLNNNSLSNNKVKVICDDAYHHLQNSNSYYDLIICDFPDPIDSDLSKLYSLSFYKLAKRRLTKKGIICTQASSGNRVKAIIRSTLSSVFNFAKSFQVRYDNGGGNVFIIASNNTLNRLNDTPIWTKYLTNEVVDSSFIEAKDECFDTDNVNTIDNSLLAKESLLYQYLDKASSEFQYDKKYRVIDLDNENQCPAKLLPSFLKYCSEDYRLILYIEKSKLNHFTPIINKLYLVYRSSFTRLRLSFSRKNILKLESYWKRYNDGSISQIESYFCPTSEREDLSLIMLEYLDNFARDYLPVDHLNHKNILNHTRLHIITRDHSGKPLMLSTVEIANFNKLLTCNIIYCRGSKRKNIISLLLGLRYVQKEFGEDIIFENWAPNKEIESIMRKFGSKIVGYYDLYTQI